MIKLESLLKWKKQGLNVNQILAFMVTPTQETDVEWNGSNGIYHDENLEELFRDLGFTISYSGEEYVDMEKAKTEIVESSMVLIDDEIAVEFDTVFIPNRFDSDTPETLIDFSTGRKVGERNEDEAIKYELGL